MLFNLHQRAIKPLAPEQQISCQNNGAGAGVGGWGGWGVHSLLCGKNIEHSIKMLDQGEGVEKRAERGEKKD